MSQKVDVKSYIVYTATGDTYHRNPKCATQPDVSPMLDLGDNMFGELEQTRVRCVGTDPDDYCGNCCKELKEQL